jgi:endoglucanase
MRGQWKRSCSGHGLAGGLGCVATGVARLATAVLCACSVSCGEVWTIGDLGDAASAGASESGSPSNGAAMANAGSTSGDLEASIASPAMNGSGLAPGSDADAQDSGPGDSGGDAPALPAACAAASEVVYVTTLPGTTGNFGTTGTVCVVYQGSVNGWGVSNGQGRVVTVIGATNVGPFDATGDANTMPALGAGSDGFIYWIFTGGADNYASLYIF